VPSSTYAGGASDVSVEANRYVETGKKLGNVVLSIDAPISAV
jgi:hypothetical protein